MIYLNLIEPGNDEQIVKLKACISKLSSYCITSDLDKILDATSSPEKLFDYGINSDGVDYCITNERYIQYLIGKSVNLRKLESARYDTIHEELDHANAPEHIRQSLSDNYSNMMALIVENEFERKYKQHVKNIIELEASAKFFAHIRSSGYKMPSTYSAEALTREQMWSYMDKYLVQYNKALQHFIIKEYARSTPEAFFYCNMIEKAMAEPALWPQILMQFTEAGLPMAQIIDDLESGYKKFCDDAEVHLNQTIKKLSEHYCKLLS
jgi:hypothetical protein